MFGRRKLEQEMQRYTRSDVSLVSQVIGFLAASRSDGLPVSPRELPICVGAASLHADTIASMPARSRAAVVTPRVQHLLHRPDPGTDYRSTIEQTVRGMFWTGYSPWLLDRPAPFTTTITALDPLNASYDAIRDTWNVGGETVDGERIYAVNLIDDPNHPLQLGESPLQQCWQPLTMYGYAYRYLIDFFAQGGNPSSILKSTHVLGNTADPSTGLTPAQRIAGEWIEARQARRPAVMDPTITLEVPNSSGELATTLEVLNHAAAEVARMLNMPGSLVNAPSAGYSLDYANVQDEMRRWLALSLGPSWISRIESGLRAITGDDTIYLDPEPVLELYVALAPQDAVELPSEHRTPIGASDV